MKWFPATLLALFLLTDLASAAPTISCHCFRDRAFDPARPAAADRYFLATAQNSLMAAVFAVDKSRLVRGKMSGVSGAELWIAHFLGARSSSGARRLLEFRSQGASWREAVARAGIAAEDLPGPFSSALVSGRDAPVLAAAAVDATLAGYLEAAPEELDRLRRHGADNHRLVMSFFLAAYSKRSAEALWNAVRGAETSWGRLLSEAGLSGDDIETEMRRLVKGDQ